MPYPTKYDRQFDYSSYQNANPSRPLPADKVNVDLNKVQLSTSEIVDFLKKSLRADGKVMNGAIGRDQIDPSVNLGFTPPTEWEAGVSYTANTSTVFYGAAFYSALVSHTSGGSFDPSKWQKIADFQELANLAAITALTSNANIYSISQLPSDADKGIYFTGAGAAALFDFTPFARTLLDDLNSSTALSTLGVTSFAQTILDDADAGAARVTLGVAIGSDVQAFDADLAAIAALSSTGILRRTGANTWGLGGAVTNSEMANMAAFTLKVNAIGSAAAPTDITIPGLPHKTTPAGNDRIILADSAASDALVHSTLTEIIGAVATGVASYNGATGAVAAPADGALYVSTSGNNSNNGLSPESAKLTVAAALAAASAGQAIYVGNGTFTLAAPLQMKPGVIIYGQKNTVFTQANAANLASLAEFNTNSAHGAGFVGCTFDGNQANQTALSGALVITGTANDVVLMQNTFRNAPGNAVTHTSGLRPYVVNNTFFNIFLYAVSVFTGTGNTSTRGTFSNNRMLAPIGYHAFGIWNSNGNTIAQNYIEATIVGTFSANTRVNTSGTTVTWVSGTNFANITPGMFVVLNGGQEFFVNAKVSNTQLTMSTTLPTLSNVPATLGTGDVIGIDCSSDNLVTGNYITGGSTCGIIISDASGGADARRNKVIGNTVIGCGEPGVCVSDGAGSQIVSDTLIANNVITNTAQTGPTAGPGGAYAAGITVLGGASTFVTGNTVTDDQGAPTVAYWLGLLSVGAGQCFVGANTQHGVGAGQVVFGGIISVAFSGWGTGAAVVSSTSYGGSFKVTFNAGTGPSANPTITVTTAATGTSSVGIAKMYHLPSGTIVGVIGDDSFTPGSKALTYFHTTAPIASTGYALSVIG